FYDHQHLDTGGASEIHFKLCLISSHLQNVCTNSNLYKQYLQIYINGEYDADSNKYFCCVDFFIRKFTSMSLKLSGLIAGYGIRWYVKLECRELLFLIDKEDGGRLISRKKKDLTLCDDPLHPMFDKIITKIDTYLDEALLCETLVTATILNAMFRLAIFEAHLPKQAPGAKNHFLNCLKKERFRWPKEFYKTMSVKRNKLLLRRRIIMRILSVHSSVVAEMMQEMMKLKLVEHKFKCLTRVSVFYNFFDSYFPLLRMCSIFAAVEKTFSAAADVCSSTCGKLLPRTVERSVSSCMWLCDGLPQDAYFESATKQINRGCQI
ncbi:hypothetical protein VP01_193g2, partial [Puccinia sorghi]